MRGRGFRHRDRFGGQCPILISGVQSTDFSRAFVKQERTQLKLVLYTPLNQDTGLEIEFRGGPFICIAGNVFNSRRRLFGDCRKAPDSSFDGSGRWSSAGRGVL